MNTDSEISAVDKFKLRYANRKFETKKTIRENHKEAKKITSFSALDSLVLQKPNIEKDQILPKIEEKKTDSTNNDILDGLIAINNTKNEDRKEESILDKYLNKISNEKITHSVQKSLEDSRIDYFQKQKESNPFKKIPVNRMTPTQTQKEDCIEKRESEKPLPETIVTVENRKDEFVRVCPHCGKEFKTTIKTKMFCCDKCRKAENDKKRRGNKPSVNYHRICPCCQKHFDTHNRFQLYCDEHKGAGHLSNVTVKKQHTNNAYVYKTVPRRMSMVGEYVNGEKIYHVTINCIHCGKNFTYDTKNPTQYRAFCSRKCQEEHNKSKVSN